jgi:hypothetical protein
VTHGRNLSDLNLESGSYDVGPAAGKGRFRRDNETQNERMRPSLETADFEYTSLTSPVKWELHYAPTVLKGWVRRLKGTRAVETTPKGRLALRNLFGIMFERGKSGYTVRR